MKMFKLLSMVLALALSVSVFAAAPSSLVVINNTDRDSDVQVHGSFTGSPVTAGTTGNFAWATVLSACNPVPPPPLGGFKTNVCAAEVYLSPNTADQLDIGGVFINLDSGNIIIAHENPTFTGYKMSPDGFGQIILQNAT